MWPAKQQSAYISPPKVSIPSKSSEIRDSSKSRIPERRDLSVEELIRELTFIVAAQKSGALHSSVSLLDKYTADTVPTHLLQSKDGLVRRLGAVLLAYIFERKSDIFRIIANDKKQPFCLSQSFLFLSKYTSSMKDFHPETLPHSVDPILFYLPKNGFPGGLPGFMNSEKLHNILVTREYLRIPDPNQMMIWFQLEDIVNQVDSGSSATDQEDKSWTPDSSIEEHGDQPQESNQNGRMHQSPGRKKAETRRSPPRKSPEKQMIQSSDPTTGHRIKCFQFFKQVQKKSPRKSDAGMKSRKAATSPSEKYRKEFKHSYPAEIRHTSFYLGQPNVFEQQHKLSGSDPTENNPRSQIVIDWISKQDYTFYTSKIKVIPPKRSGAFELALKKLQSGRSKSVFTFENEFKIDGSSHGHNRGNPGHPIKPTIADTELKDQKENLELLGLMGVSSDNRNTTKDSREYDQPSEIPDGLPKKSILKISKPKHPAPEAELAIQNQILSPIRQNEVSNPNRTDSPTKSVSHNPVSKKPNIQLKTRSKSRRSTVTSIQQALLGPDSNRKVSPQRAPVSLQDCEHPENMKNTISKKVSTLISTQASKNNFARGQHIILQKPSDNNSQDSEDLLPISRLKNGNFFRIVYDRKDHQPHSKSVHLGKIRQAPEAASSTSKTAFQISTTRTTTSHSVLRQHRTETNKSTEPQNKNVRRSVGSMTSFGRPLARENKPKSIGML